ncbi:MAG: hypothetical protein L3J24_05985 [Xanthomonadales bacterium]|nr:hypothetical protein [Xanthomonadales bacterium]
MPIITFHPVAAYRLFSVVGAAIMLLGMAANVVAQTATALNTLNFVGDIDTSLPASGGTAYNSDDAIIDFSIATELSTSSNELGTLGAAGIDGFHKTGDGCGDSVYSLDITTLIAGTAMRPADVFTAAGVKVLDASTAGVPDGVNINALSRDPSNCDLIISIDTTALLSGSAFRADDLIRWNSSNGFSLFQQTNFGANIDAVHYLSASRWLVSLEVSTQLPDLAGLDEQIFEIGPTFQLLALDLRSIDNSWDAAGVNALWALPQPLTESIFSDSFE